MGFARRIFKRNFFIRLRSWEYWPFWVVQLPLFLYWFWLSLRARSLLFFSTSNPSILLGGMLGESKYGILKDMPAHLIPKTILIKVPVRVEQVMDQLNKCGLNFPLVFKPDIGERGFMVERIFSIQDVEHYLKKSRGHFLVQELLDLPVESSVFFTRFPNEPMGKVTSVVLKEMLTVTGDGRSTVQQLIFAKDRAKLQWSRLRENTKVNFDRVPEVGETVELNPIGNHCLGTKFLNANFLIDEKVSASFDRISKQLPEFYFGRFDLKCESIEKLKNGEVKIMEVNGCGAEPSHIYQPGFSIWNAYSVLFRHWKNLFTISTQNKKRGFKYTSFKDGVQIFKHFKAQMKTA